MNHKPKKSRPLPRLIAWCVGLLAVAACTGRAGAAAGISDALATQGCWLRPPYALLKCQSEGGWYPASLIRGRGKRSWDEWAYDGIVFEQEVASQVERVALTPRFAVLEVCWGKAPSFEVVDLTDPDATVVRLAGEDEVRRYLGEHGEGGAPLRFQSFEEVYRERGPATSLSACCSAARS